MLSAEIGQRQAQKAEGAEQHPAGRHLAQPELRHSIPAIGPLKPLATITGSINIPASNGVFLMHKLQLLSHQQLKTHQGNQGGHRHHHPRLK